MATLIRSRGSRDGPPPPLAPPPKKPKIGLKPATNLKKLRAPWPESERFIRYYKSALATAGSGPIFLSHSQNDERDRTRTGRIYSELFRLGLDFVDVPLWPRGDLHHTNGIFEGYHKIAELRGVANALDQAGGDFLRSAIEAKRVVILGGSPAKVFKHLYPTETIKQFCVLYPCNWKQGELSEVGPIIVGAFAACGQILTLEELDKAVRNGRNYCSPKILQRRSPEHLALMCRPPTDSVTFEILKKHAAKWSPHPHVVRARRLRGTRDPDDDPIVSCCFNFVPDPDHGDDERDPNFVPDPMSMTESQVRYRADAAWLEVERNKHLADMETDSEFDWRPEPVERFEGDDIDDSNEPCSPMSDNPNDAPFVCYTAEDFIDDGVYSDDPIFPEDYVNCEKTRTVVPDPTSTPVSQIHAWLRAEREKRAGGRVGLPVCAAEVAQSTKIEVIDLDDCDCRSDATTVPATAEDFARLADLAGC